MEPPAAMQRSRIFAGEGFGGVLPGRGCGGRRGRAGWRLPSPAWKTLATRRPASRLRRSISLMHVREGGAGNDAVLHDVVGRDAAHGGEGGFAAFPDEGALGFGLRDADFGGGVGAADFVDVGHEGVDFGDGAVEFDEEKRAAHRIVGVDGGFGGLDGEACPSFRWRRAACPRR